MPPLNLGDTQILDGNPAEKRTIPKFASFRPKQASSGATDDTGQPYIEARGRDDTSYISSIKRPKVQKHSSIKRQWGGNNEQGVAKEEPHQSLQRAARTGHAQSEESPRLYAVDRIGDPKNLTFGAIDRYAIPSYFRFGAGNVLGSPVGRKINRPASSEKGLILSYTENSQRREGDRRALWKSAQARTKELRIRPQSSNSTAFGIDADFVSLEAAQGVKRRRRNNGSSLRSPLNSDGEDTHYRSVNGKAKVEGCLRDKDLASASDASLSSDDVKGSASATHGSIQNTRMELSRKVDENLEDVNTWLDLIRHQDKVLAIDSQKISLTNAEQRSNAEIKLSMYEKALGSVKDPSGRETLLLGRLKEAARVWDSQKLSSEWQSILRDNSSSLVLWKEYLNFSQTTFATFRYENAQTTYKNCLSWLRNIRSVPGTASAKLEELYTVQVYIVLRMTLLMRESGFGEQAVAAWQALLEYEFYKPPGLCHPDHEQRGSLHGITLSKFERFWDSEIPRIGEDGCKGWIRFDQTSGEHPQPRVETATQPGNVGNLWEIWVQSEHRQGLVARNPARTIDEGVENDPYRVILFSDIQSFLIDSPSAASRAVCLAAFLAFCHLPPYHGDNSDDTPMSWWREGYLRNEALDTPNSALQSFQSRTPEREIPEKPPSSVSLKRNSFESPIEDYRLSPDTLFPVSWFSAFSAWRINYFEDRGPLERAWVLRTLGQLVSSGIGGDGLAEYYLALELCVSPETVKKIARGLLKKRPSSLRLYDAYALIEYRLRNAGNGEKALITSLKMCKTLDEATQRGSILLWCTWVWELLIVGNIGKALKVMLMFGQGEVHSDPPPGILIEIQTTQPALLLRAESALTTTRDHLLSLGEYRNAAFAIDCLVLFNYLRSGLSLSAATSAFKSNLQHLTSYTSYISSIHELIHQSFARLLYYHITHTPLVKPSDIRSLLAESITLFPQNTIFLSLYAWNEARFRIDDRVRSIVKDVVLAQNEDEKSKRQESVIPHFFAIHSELGRSVTFGSNVSTIRSTFERAVESESGAHCAGLWKLYFVFEHSRGDNIKAKNVFWRAVKACPWAKELYMLAFRHLRGAGGFGDEDLRGVYELMVQMEIRIHVSLEDHFDVIDGSRQMSRRDNED